MLIIVLTAVTAGLLVFKELKPQYRQDKKAFWLYTGCLTAAVILWGMYGLDIKAPSFAGPLKDVISTLFALK